jgi:hypothetical protein
VLVLEDAGGEPLERLLGAPTEVERFLRLAISFAKGDRQARQPRRRQAPGELGALHSSSSR